MKDFVKKYWITLLGVGFIFLAFLYFLKLAIDLEWIPPTARAAIGMAIGLSGLFAGYTLVSRTKGMFGEIAAGLGTSILYATFAYASFSKDIQWSANALMISLIALSSLVTIVGYRMNMRILVFLSLLGALLTPVVIRAHVEQDWLLFLYVLVINIAALWLSAIKDWQELRVMSFVATVFIFISYYLYFDPESWGKPFFYASSLFLVYMTGLILASFHEKK